MSETSTGPGLRERKKLQAMRTIQVVALDLFDKHGYAKVTVEQVAAEAEVSPSSVYRYFGTKERLVLHDEYDPQLLTLLATDSTPIVTAGDLLSRIRTIVAGVLDHLDREELRKIERRMRYSVTEPDVRTRMARDAEGIAVQLRELIAQRSGASPESLEIRVVVAAALWGFLGAVDLWVESDFAESLVSLIDRTMDILSRGGDVVLAGPVS
ncbi:TetR/AcrR family transcriptional regulator [Rhodococcus sp. NPDC058521]|uniref:TetR/AcrR family transcriptional regulator n=1 Tax=Rhodococcus sp. NPDC058521 TaxID=3346536 RepID=UPI003660CEC0